MRFIRTTRHPSASIVGDATSFDDVYEREASLDAVYARIVDALVEAATEHGEVLYAVPGSPLVAERTVELLRADDRVEVDVVPALSFLDLVWSRLGIDPLAAGVRLVDGQRFSVEAAGERGPLVVAQCDTAPGAVRHQAVDRRRRAERGRRAPPPRSARRAACSRSRGPSSTGRSRPTTSPRSGSPRCARPVASELVRFAELVRTLRRECPWDREQTHRTLTRHLLEETYETLEAIDALDGSRRDDRPSRGGARRPAVPGVLPRRPSPPRRAGSRWPTWRAVIHDKLVHRHPHVFGSVEAESAEQVLVNWEQIKKAEKGRSSVMEGVPGDLPALLYAHKIQRKAASVGLRLGRRRRRAAQDQPRSSTSCRRRWRRRSTVTSRTSSATCCSRS